MPCVIADQWWGAGLRPGPFLHTKALCCRPGEGLHPTWSHLGQVGFIAERWERDSFFLLPSSFFLNYLFIDFLQEIVHPLQLLDCQHECYFLVIREHKKNTTKTRTQGVRCGNVLHTAYSLELKVWKSGSWSVLSCLSFLICRCRLQCSMQTVSECFGDVRHTSSLVVIQQ